MKKLFLLLATGSLSLAGIAQENTTILATHAQSSAFNLNKMSAEKLNAHQSFYASKKASGSLDRTSAWGTQDWYNLWNDEYVDATSTPGYYFTCYQDSNLLDNSFTPAANVFFHGMGMSFDPTDSAYGPQAQTYQQPTYFPNPSQSYYVDSVQFFYHYVRNNAAAVGDSLIIEIARSGLSSTIDSSVYALGYTADSGFSRVRFDSAPAFTVMRYDAYGAPKPNDCFDSFKMPQTSAAQRIAISLDNILADTIPGTGGDNYFQSAINTPTTANGIYITPGDYLTSYVFFKSGVNYAVNTPIASANYVNLYAGEPKGSSWFMQSSHNTAQNYPGSYQCGVISSSQILYEEGGGFPYDGHQTLVPSVAYCYGNGYSPGFSVPQMGFHIYFQSESVANVNKAINSDNVYPNPANNEVNVAFSLTQTSNATISLSNMMGQVVASQSVNNVMNGKVTFNTANIADGIYIYTIESNGQRTTGRVVVAH